MKPNRGCDAGSALSFLLPHQSNSSQHRDSDRLAHHGTGAIETTQFSEANDFSLLPPQKITHLVHIFSLYTVYMLYIDTILW